MSSDSPAKIDCPVNGFNYLAPGVQVVNQTAAAALYALSGKQNTAYASAYNARVSIDMATSALTLAFEMQHNFQALELASTLGCELGDRWYLLYQEIVSGLIPHSRVARDVVEELLFAGDSTWKTLCPAVQ